VTFFFALEKIVRRLNSVQRRDSLEALHLLRRIVADSNSANLALLVECPKSSGGLLDGNTGIRPVHLVNVNVVRLETTQRIVEFLENTLPRGVAFDPAIRPVDADLRGDDHAIPAAMLAQGFTHNRFGAPITVDGRSIDQIDAAFECRMNGANGFLLVGSAPHPAPNGPGTERDSGANKICTVDFNIFQHVVSSFLVVWRH